MSPGALSDLATRIAALEAKSRQIVTPAVTNVTTAATAVGLSPTWLATAQVWSKALATLTLDNAWHTITPTGIPVAAKLLMIDGYVQNQGAPNNVLQELNFRKDSSWTGFVRGTKTNGVATSYENDQAYQMLIPKSAQGSFDYLATATMTAVEIRVVGYWA